MKVSRSFKQEVGKVAWRSPSNIALVKYWGKFGNQYPKNPNISFTLANCYTDTSIQYQPKASKSDNISVSFRFEGKANLAFEQKILTFLDKIKTYFDYLPCFHLDIESSNSFPHSAGIASSASSMSALALCLVSIEKSIIENNDEAINIEKSSIIARIGSGSACRSIFPKAAIWGILKNKTSSSNDYAISFEDELHPIFKSFKDAVVIVSSKEKSVSSRAGHSLMENNIFAEARYEQARQHMQQIIPALQQGNIEVVGTIMEQEALTLHALMMSSSPSFVLLQPNTLKIIDLIKQYRTEKNVPLYFTLDAGPNVHVLYPKQYEQEVELFISEVLLPYSEQRQVIYDEVGSGPVQLI